MVFFDSFPAFFIFRANFKNLQQSFFPKIDFFQLDNQKNMSYIITGITDEFYVLRTNNNRKGFV